MSYTGPCYWLTQLSAFCDPALDWNNPGDMHQRCRGTFIAKNALPGGLGRTYGRCPCACHKGSGVTISEQELAVWMQKQNEKLDAQT